MTGELSKKFHGVGIGPLSKRLAVNSRKSDFIDIIVLLVQEIIIIVSRQDVIRIRVR